MAKGLHNAYYGIDGDLPERQVTGFGPETAPVERKRRVGHAMVERTCEGCGAAFMAQCREVRRGHGRFCNRSCQSAYTQRKRHRANPQVGERNPHWKGGVSFRPSHYTKQFRQRFPEKWRAQQAVMNAVRRGRLVRPGACSACGTACKPHGHHDDYSQPLAVRWLCQPCHLKHHHAMRKSAVLRDIEGPAVTSFRRSA